MNDRTHGTILETVKLSSDTMYSTQYSKQIRKMPDWDNLIVRCIANDLINKRMMGNQHGLGEEQPVWQPSGYNGGWGWAGWGLGDW